uniref:60S acidic ribosomal protein P0 n=1 Tax=Octopus bimaculoides TaxID=37653 RepID=A0A0L8GF80_OCTBM
MVKEDKSTWKANYFIKIIQLLNEYPKCFIVNADNVGSRQMQTIRMSLRGYAVVLMGKNTMMRKAIRGHLEHNAALERLLPHIKNNVGFVFTKNDLADIRDRLLNNKTSFFQALSIPTKISRGTIEILNDVRLIKEADKVGASEATLLNMLNISPFSYGLVIEQVYDSGTVFAPGVLDITDDDIRKKFMSGVTNVASLSLAIGYPTLASIPHLLVNGFKNLVAISLETDIEFEEAKEIKELLSDPEKMAAALAASAATTAAAAPSTPAAEEKKEEKVESEEESDEDMGLGLFD